ncbi:MAG: UvrD-helicase domain-containing protein [Proteobacteria bacterium]|nr:UvrD-helicase domain-containing protein [Pseudomonadota bacterium]
MHSLNAAQREAVRYDRGPLLVLAGAGSGKTRVIAAKIAHLVERGTAASSIVAITFTNKAAREMRERARGMLARAGHAAAANDVRISTFHALGLSILRAEHRALGLAQRFTILDPSDLEPIVAELVATADRGRARAAHVRISRWKNALVTPAEALGSAASDDERIAAKAYARYGETLRAWRAVDLDDLIVLPLELFVRDAAAKERWQRGIAHVLIDEYQDTNAAQYRLFRMLTARTTPFTAVGDDDQAIYGWRGACADNLAALARDHPNLEVIKLEQNYRSTVRILRCANALIGNNPKVFDKRLWTELGHGDPLCVTAAADEDDEAERVVAAILAHKFEHRTRFADYAILYRGNHQARPFETALRAKAAPYEVSGGTSIFERSEIKDIVAYLRLIANDDDDPAFLRAIAAPRRGIGEASLKALGAIAAAKHVSLFEAAFTPEAEAAIGPRPRAELAAFCALVNDLGFRAEREPAGRLLAELVRKTGYADWLTATLDRKEAIAKSASVDDFIGWLSRKGESEGKNLLDLTQMIALVTMLESREDGAGAPDAVHLSTIHAAKGLEFAHVFLVGIEEGILPHREAVEAGNVDEERRLMYVGLTRAQRSVQLSYCRSRKRAGGKVACTPSRFLAELDQEELRHAGAPLSADEAAQQRKTGSARLTALKALVAR